MRNKIIVGACFLLSSCSFFEKTSFYYKTYTHPSIQFSIDYPRSWKIQEGGAMGGQVIFLSNKTDAAFQANANLVVTKADIKDLNVLSRLSVQQFKLVLNEYELITQNETKLGKKLNGLELRGRYKAKEGIRILRTIVAVDGDREFVFTFTSAFDKENNYTQIINHMIESFKL